MKKVIRASFIALHFVYVVSLRPTNVLVGMPNAIVHRVYKPSERETKYTTNT